MMRGGFEDKIELWSGREGSTSAFLKDTDLKRKARVHLYTPEML